MSADLRVIAYAPNGASKGPLPNPQDVSVGYPLDDVGALTLTYPPDAARADLLGQPLELAVEVSWDAGATWSEPPSSRFLYLRDGRDPIKTGDAFSVEAAAYILRLSKALVGLTGLNAEGNREFLNMTPGDILLTLWNEAQARGALTGMTATWTATQGTGGTAWPSTIPQVAYEPGKDLLSILNEMADQGYIDFRTQGRSVQVYVANAAAGMAADRTTGANPVSLRFGRDLTEAPFRRTWEGLADTAIVRGDNNSSLTRTNASAITPWGRQETYVTASGVDDAGTLTVIADAALALTAAERTEYTYGLEFGAAAYFPFTHYGVGEYVLAAPNGNAPQRMRVRQVTLTRDENGAVAGNVVLNDRFLEADVLTARRLSQLTQGATQGGTGTTPATPSPSGNDILAPAQVGVVTTSSTAYVEKDGRVRSQITLDWPDVTTNADGTTATDVDHYEVQKRVTGQTEWKDAGTRILSTWSDSPYNPGDSWDFRVRAVDTVFNRGAWSATVTRVAGSDTTGPVKPSTPTATSRLGVARIAWDGLSATAGAMDSDFRYVAVHVSTVSNFTPTDTTKVGELLGAAYAVAGPLTYNTTYYARLVPYDTSGNAGTVSDQVAFTIAPLVDVSNFPDTDMQTLYARTGHFITLTADNFSANLIEGMWIKAGAVTADKVSVGSLSDNLVLNPKFQDADPANPARALKWVQETVDTYRETNASAPGGVWMVLHGDPATGAYGKAMSAVFPVTPGDTLAVSCKAAATQAGSAFYARIGYFATNPGDDSLSDQDGTYYDGRSNYSGLPIGYLSPEQWERVEFQHTVPVGKRFARVTFFNYLPTVNTYIVVSDVAVRRGVRDADVTDITPGKIKTGLMQATEKIVAGGSVSSGARVEFSGAGIKAYNAAGNPTVDIKASDGSATFTGAFNTNFPSYTGARISIAEDATFGGGLITFYNNTYKSGQIWSSGSTATNGYVRVAGQDHVILAVDGDPTNNLALWLSISTADAWDVNIRGQGRGTHISGGNVKIDDRVDAADFIKIGVNATGAFSAVSTDKTIHVTLSPAFPDANYVVMTAPRAGAVGTARPVAQPFNLTSTGFDLACRRDQGTASFDVMWTAIRTNA